eukprot:365592-Chlamydomonas_euryale.AAC.13
MGVGSASLGHTILCVEPLECIPSHRAHHMRMLSAGVALMPLRAVRGSVGMVHCSDVIPRTVSRQSSTELVAQCMHNAKRITQDCLRG